MIVLNGLVSHFLKSSMTNVKYLAELDLASIKLYVECTMYIININLDERYFWHTI